MLHQQDQRDIRVDPANTTLAKNSKPCFVCNSEYVSDKTAQHFLAVEKASLSLANEASAPRRYLEGHYWANAAVARNASLRQENGYSASQYLGAQERNKFVAQLKAEYQAFANLVR